MIEHDEPRLIGQEEIMQPEVSFEMDLYQKTSENQILANNGDRKLIATIEGELIIRTQDVVVFQEDVLLLEFALALQLWIKSNINRRKH